MTRWQTLYRCLVVVCAAERVLELTVSQRNERRSGEVIGTAGERSYPFMVALHAALFVLPLLEQRLHPRRPRAVIVAPALAALVGATALRLWVIRALGSGWNVRGRVPAGLHVVDKGPYRFVRHPNYDAVAIEIAALPLAAPAPITALVLSAANAAVLTVRIRGEERLLERVPGYQERMAGRPRFLPRPGLGETRRQSKRER